MTTAEILLRGFAAGAMVATALGLTRGLTWDGVSAARLAGAAFCLSAAGFAVHSEGAETQALGWLRPIADLLSAGAVGWFWLFAMTLFEDRRPHRAWLLGPGALIVLAAVARLVPPPRSDGLWVAHNLVEIGFVAHAVGLAWRGARGDLVESRRAFRTPFLILVAATAAAMSGQEIAGELGVILPWESLSQAIAVAVLGLAGAQVLSSRAVFEAPPRGAAVADARDAALLERLGRLMSEDDLWRREGLTIGELAQAAGAPEHRLRRLINGGLGHRNFAQYVNAHRIAAAQAALADPARAGSTIAEIAFEHGFGSLAPFNRAFRDVAGETPSAWRTRVLGG